MLVNNTRRRQYSLLAGVIIVFGLGLVISLSAYLLRNPDESIPQPDSDNFFVIFYTMQDKTRVGIPCIGVCIGNKTIISTISCFKPYQDNKLCAIIGFEADNDTEPILLTDYINHRDYIRHNRFDADVKRFYHKDDIPNDSIQLETNSSLERTLNFYTNDPYQLYRISVDKNHKTNKVQVFNDQIGECGQLIYCLKLKNPESIGSVLVAQRNNNYLLLGIQQNQPNVNENVPYTRLPLYAAWIHSFDG